MMTEAMHNTDQFAYEQMIATSLLPGEFELFDNNVRMQLASGVEQQKRINYNRFKKARRFYFAMRKDSDIGAIKKVTDQFDAAGHVSHLTATEYIELMDRLLSYDET